MKKKYVKIKKCAKICTAAAVAVILMGAALLPAFAVSEPGDNGDSQKHGSMLILGDSISTGYGLQNYTPGGNPYLCQSYGNILAASLGLEGNKSYINRAVNGDASDDLLALLPSLTGNIKASEFVIVSVGGNDLLHILPRFASVITGAEVTDLQAAAGAVMAMDAAVLKEKLADPSGLAVVLGAISEYSKNLPLIIEGIHAANPAARVIFLAQYNPMAGSFASPEFGEFAGTVIDSLNLALRTAVTAAGYGYEVADIPSIINVNAVGYTNISDADIHPNADGHAKMAEYLIAMISGDPTPADVTTGADADTTVGEPVDEKGDIPEESDAAISDDDSAKEEAPIDTDNETTAAEDIGKSGCGSSLAVCAAALASVCGAAAAIDARKKKK